MRRLIITFFLTTLVFSSTSHIYALDSNNADKNSDKKHLLLANAPPGLKKQGLMHTPSGKTPPGWNEGLKRGWNKDKNWRWNKKNKLWENKNWQWNSTDNHWQKTKGWGKSH